MGVDEVICFAGYRPERPARWSRSNGNIVYGCRRQRRAYCVYKRKVPAENISGRPRSATGYVVRARKEYHCPRLIWRDDTWSIVCDLVYSGSAKTAVHDDQWRHILGECLPQRNTGTSRKDDATGRGWLTAVVRLEARNSPLPCVRLVGLGAYDHPEYVDTLSAPFKDLFHSVLRLHRRPTCTSGRIENGKSTWRRMRTRATGSCRS